MNARPDEEDKHRLANARLGYEVAVHLHTACSGGVWSVFSAMLVANSILLGGITVILVQKAALPWLSVFLAIAGLVMCVVWGIIVKRAETFSLYYLLCARKLEEDYLKHQLTTLHRGADLSAGKKVPPEVECEDSTRLGSWGRLATGRCATHVVILTFVALYALALLWSLVPSMFYACRLLRPLSLLSR